MVAGALLFTATRARNLASALQRFWHDDTGTASLEFVIVFPVFFSFLLMTYESGIVSIRHVMLERGLDLAVRDVRIGQMTSPTREALTARICEVAMVIPDCTNQVQLEMIRRDPRNWTAISSSVACIDRSVAVQPVVEFTTGGNNELIFLRACARIDPFFPTTGLGKAVSENNNNPSASGSYALVAQSAFIIEPFAAE